MTERLAGRYVLLRRLGAGGMGEVFLARDLTTGSECALKRLRPGAASLAADLTRREFEALTRLRHPAVVSVYELGFEPDGSPYYTMEYVPGLPPDKALARGDWPSLYFVAAQVAQGLEALHAAGVIHGDLKPSNLLVIPGPAAGDRPQGVRLLDFGLSAILGRDTQGHRGTAGFAAPELVRGGAPSPATDLYGFGATLYALVAGRPPFEADAPSSTLRRQQSGPPPSQPLEEAGAPAPLVRLVLEMMAPDPAQRPREAGAVRRNLERMHPAARRPLAERLRSVIVVGRERELATIEPWARAAGSRARVLFVTGEPGAGKSALLDELAARAALDGRRVARLSCGAFTGPGAVARALLTRWAAEAGVDPESSAALAGLRGEAGAAPVEPGALAELAIQWTRDAGGAALPRLVLLDDSERLDPVSGALMRRLALHPAGAMLRWVLTRRNAPSPDAREDEQVLRDAGMAESLTLPALDLPAVERLAAARLNQPAPAVLTSFLWSRAEGHAGLTVELLIAAAEAGALRESDAGLVVDESKLASVRTPASFEASLLSTYEALPEPARAAGRVLAVWGRRIDPATARALDKSADDQALEHLVAAGLARRDDEGEVTLAPVLGERILEGLDPGVRRALHAAAAKRPGLADADRFRHLAGAGDAPGALAAARAALATSHDGRLCEQAAALADSELPEQAGEWHALAGRDLAARGLYARAIPHVEKALALATGDEERIERRQQLTNCYLRAGRLSDVERSVREGLAESPPPAARVRLLCDEVARLSALGESQRALETIQSAWTLAESLPPSPAAEEARGAAANNLAQTLLLRGDYQEAEVLARTAADAYQRAGNGVGEIRALGTRAAVARARQLPDETERLYDEAISSAREHGYRLALEELLLGYAGVLIEAGRWEDMRLACAEAVRVSLEDERSAAAAFALAGLAQVDGLTGRVRDALHEGRAARRLTHRHVPLLEPLAWRSLAQAHRVAGRLARAQRCAWRAMNLAGRSTHYEAEWCRIELGRIWTAAGRWQEAGALWATGLSDGKAPQSIGQAILGVLEGRAAVRERDYDRATSRLEVTEGWLSSGPAPYAAAFAALLRAELALAQGRVRDGVDNARKALAGFAALPAPGDAAQAQLDLARLALDRSSDARIPVGSWLDEAAAMFERHGNRRGRERALGLQVEWLRRTGGRGTIGDRDRNLIESVSRLLNSLPDLKELTQRAMELAVEQFDAERGVLLLRDAESGTFTPMAEHGGVDASTRRDAVSYSRRVVERVTSSGGSLVISDAPSDPRAASKSVLDLRLRSIVCVPMYLGGRVVGAVYMDDSRRPDAFSDADRGLLEGFAHLMAVAIENSRGAEEVRRANELLVGENLQLRREVGSRFQAQSLIGSSSAMQQVLSVLERAALGSSTVLITGENGTGKELIARILHHSGKRRLEPFVAVNCGAIPESLIESELFGILPQTATDVRGRDGKFVLANGGTLFLDEIGEMPLNQQVALLSAIANREITPVGGGKPIPVDVRIIAATNADLRKLIQQGRFREDLFYRLNVIPIEVPALRERKADIPPLAHHFVAQFAKQQDREVPELSHEFLAALMQSDWLGNVRELQNYIERVMAMNPGRILRPSPLPQDLEERGATLRIKSSRKLNEVVADTERRILVEALQKARGNQSVAARSLGMTEQSLRYRMRKYGLPGPRQILRVRRNLR